MSTEPRRQRYFQILLVLWLYLTDGQSFDVQDDLTFFREQFSLYSEYLDLSYSEDAGYSTYAKKEIPDGVKLIEVPSTMVLTACMKIVVITAYCFLYRGRRLTIQGGDLQTDGGDNISR